MFSRYREILALPGARRFFWWGLIARVPRGLGGLSTFMLVQIEYQSYAKAGAVLGVASLGYAILSPAISRWPTTSGGTTAPELSTSFIFA